ncbi:MAG: Rab family GTPase [Burkholderiaceae bacterium]
MSYKVMMLGDSGVGKTSISRRLKFNAFDTQHKSTIGVELYSLDAISNDPATKIVLWDTDGRFGDKLFERVFLKGADAAIIVADITNTESIESMLRLGNQFQQVFALAPVQFVLNKSDLTTLSDERMNDLRSQCEHLQVCSALTGDGVMRAISELSNYLVGNLPALDSAG